MDKKKILVADYDPNIRLLISKMLHKDYIVLEADNGEEAMDVARQQSPDLILMDIRMPKVDGYTACSAITADQVTEATPVLMLTGIGYEPSEKLSQIGASGYITKPLSLENLLGIINELLPGNT